MLKNLKIKTKIIFLFSSITILIVLLTGVAISKVITMNIRNEMYREMETLSDLVSFQTDNYIEGVIQNYLNGIVNTSYDVINKYYKEVQNGNLSEKEAKKIVKELLANIKVGETGYIYCVDSKGIIQLHPNNEVLYTNLKSYEFIQEQIMQKTGYLKYKWKNPNEETARKKSLYMKYFQPWDWIISASSYQSEFLSLLDINTLRDRLLSIKIGKTGYPYMIDKNGVLKIHPWLEGKNLVENYTDAQGNYIFDKLLKEEQGSFSYSWVEQNGKIRNKILNFKKLNSIDWIIGMSTYEAEFLEIKNKIFEVLLFSTLVSIAFFIISFYIIGNIISKPIEVLSKNAKKISNFDLNIKFNEDYLQRKDEIGLLEKSFSEIYINLKDIVKEIITSAEKLNLSIQEIENSNLNLVTLSFNQTNFLEAVFSNIEEVNTIIKLHTDKSIELAVKMQQTKEKTVIIDSISKKLKNYISEIKQKSYKINLITDVLDDISFQTNLLAINAAVESSRISNNNAQGFGVIAAEIRKLSKKSSYSSKSISTLINETQLKVSEGEELIDSVTKDLYSISNLIEDVDNDVKEISAGSEEEKMKLESITVSMKSLNEIAQSNLKITKETAKISEDLKNEYFKFLCLIDKFKF